MRRFELEASDGAILTGFKWELDTPRAVVQIAHGAAEHMGRYDRLARFLGSAGYAAIGADHRGHGANARLHGLGNFGPGGFAGLVDDLRSVTKAARIRYPDAPVVLLGHSMGSFASQAFLASHADLIDGLVLSGTAAVDELLASGDSSSGLEACKAAFEPARTPSDWLSRDEAEVDAYIADPLCGFELQLSSLATMPAAVDGVRRPERLAVAVERQIPVLVISGEVDPIVGPDQSSARRVVNDYLEAGLLDVQHRIYAGGRHEMFNEINRDEVMGDLVAWPNARF